MARWFANQLEENECGFPTSLLFKWSNIKNYVFWGNEVSDQVAERSLHRVKCTAGYAISLHGVIRPYWSEDDVENQSQSTVNDTLLFF